MPTSPSSRRAVLVTIGDPAGIGPEVTLKAISKIKPSLKKRLLVIGDRFVVDEAKKVLGLRIDIPLLDISNISPKDFTYGVSRPEFGAASMEYIDRALEILKKGGAGSLVTAPVNKYSISSAGYADFQGHTEYLAGKTSTRDYAMMFVGEKLKVVLATRHIPLGDVPKTLSVKSLSASIALAHESLKRYFGIRDPRIAICGLNPHAGEGGKFGDEEKTIIKPAMRLVSRKGGKVYGPYPSDTAFYQVLQGRFDAVVAMYHDQGLIPFKMLYFTTGVNMTLGLPFIRTSPDHGTAFDIAGKGKADPASMAAAIGLACRLTFKE
ncbi:MAG: 4-hydroxythreonine-4-phosphate dehydrogenase PdxA [Candidatus Omnitrophica bacterium]|nr:4-hydroxythreonine-4-phosphate dehydrogenase PdxA [Candidatus Omnitrophota bacterium]